MKKFLILLVVLSTALFHLAAVEPAIVLSLAFPSIIQISEFEESSNYNIEDSLSDNELFMVTMPQQIIDRKMKLKDAFSLKMPLFAYDAYGIYASRGNFAFVSGEGNIVITRLLDIKDGEMKINVAYEDDELNYMIDGKSKSMNVDGAIQSKVSIYGDSVASVTVSTNSSSVSGAKEKDSNGTVEIVFNIKPKSSLLDEYRAREDWDEMQKEVIDILQRIEFVPWEDVGLSSSSSNAEVIRFARAHKCFDALECMTVFFMEKDNGLSGVLDVFSELIDPVMYINGELAEEIELSKAVDVVNLVVGFIS